MEEGQIQQSEEPGQTIKKSRLWTWLMIIGIIVIIAIILIWGFYTNWGKSFNAQEAREYCAQACKDLDKEKFCEAKTIVHFENEGAIWKDVTCQDLVIGQKAESCGAEIICGSMPS